MSKRSRHSWQERRTYRSAILPGCNLLPHPLNKFQRLDIVVPDENVGKTVPVPLGNLSGS